eukprot:TRINITY_DN11012_c0_g1_i1.p1 TRINITY_DN11012_c0_g1~~TRINITY_DN11012_c0_g1_i1.p1  ORF type:complete len:445 (+),score=103.78 TRINITY_DN11012_c0_g1_i1:54-1388(+)
MKNNREKKRGNKRGRNPIKIQAQERRVTKRVNIEEWEKDIDNRAVFIEGSYGEGGGQVLRYSFALAAILGKAIHVKEIRAKRKTPGLAAQHLAGLELVTELHQGLLLGGEVRSTEVRFSGKGFDATKTSYVVDCKTAGSITLLMQVSLPCSLYSPHTLDVTYKGGTNAIMAPQIDYTIQVFKPQVSKMGVNFDMTIEKRGYYPAGGGIVHLKVPPITEPIKPITLLDPGRITSVHIRAFVAGRVPMKVAERMAKEAKKHMKRYFGDLPVDFQQFIVQETEEAAMGTGTGIIVVAYSSTGCIYAGSSLGERGKQAENVAEEATTALITDLKYNGCVDEYLQDQLIIYMALADGVSKIKTGPLSLHTSTAIHFTKLMTGAEFVVTKTPDSDKTTPDEDSFVIQCTGIGWRKKPEPVPADEKIESQVEGKTDESKMEVEKVEEEKNI